MPDRKTTAAIILKIEKTQELMQSLINYYEYIESLLKDTSGARNHARNVKNYFKILKNKYLDNFKKAMKNLYDMERRKEKIGKKEAEKRKKAAKKALEEARKIERKMEKIKKI